MKKLGIIDGYIVDLDANKVNMLDRGYQFGDGAYEIIRVYNGHCFALGPHLDSLFHALRELKIPAVYTFEEILEFHVRLILESGMQEGEIYTQITRGVAPRCGGFPAGMVPCLTMSVIEADPEHDKLCTNGVRAMTTPDLRWLRCDIKTLNLLGNVLAKQAAREAGCFEALMLRDGIVTDGAESSFFVVKDEVLWTHPQSPLITNGISRRIIKEKLAPQMDMQVVEKKFDKNFLSKAEEAFICSTSLEILPVTHIDRRAIGDGKVGPFTRRLQELYQELIQLDCFSH